MFTDVDIYRAIESGDPSTDGAVDGAWKLSDELVFFEHSPVVEVAVSIEFLQLPGLGAVRLVRLHDIWRDAFPKVREQPALPPTAAMVMPGGMQTFQFQIGNGLPPLRVWMLNESEDELLQVQNDRLFLNWRKAFGGDRPYPRYEHLKEVYLQVFAQFLDSLKQEPVGTFQPHTAVVTYVNRFKFEEGESLKDAFAPLDVNWDPLGEGSTEVRLAVPVGVDGLEGQTGLINVTANTDVSDPAATYGYLEIVARTNLQHPGIDDPLSALDLSHVAAIRCFERITTPKMHSRWGKA